MQMSATLPPEPDIEELESSAKSAIKYIGDLRKHEQQKQREQARAKVETEINTARQLDAESTTLTRNLRRYF